MLGIHLWRIGLLYAFSLKLVISRQLEFLDKHVGRAMAEGAVL